MIKLEYGNSHDFTDNKDAVKLSNKDVQSLIDEVMENLKNTEDEDFFYCATGDTIVFGVKYEDETDVFVCRNYEEGQIYKEDGVWKKIDWLYEEPEEEEPNIDKMLESLSKADLINLLMKVIDERKN